MPLEYAGFCPVALVSGQGFVLPGNRRIGYLGTDFLIDGVTVQLGDYDWVNRKKAKYLTN